MNELALPPQRINRTAGWFTDWVFWALFVLTLGLRLMLAWIYRDTPNSDAGIVSLMAQQVAAGGPWPVFFFGQAYMGSAEPLVSALMCRLFGVSGFSVNLGTVLVGLLMVPVLYGWARSVAGRSAGRAAALFGVIVSGGYSYYMISPRGGYALALVCISGVLWLAARIVEQEWSGERARVGLYVGLGLLAGVGWWTSQMITAVLGAAALAFLFILFRPGVWWKCLLAALCFFAGSWPWWWWNAHHGWATFAFTQSLGTVSATHGLWLIFRHRLPDLLDFGGEPATAWWTHLHALLAGPRVFLVVQLVAGAAYLLLLASALIAHARQTSPRIRIHLLLVVGYVAIFLALACRSHFVEMAAPRYLLPIVPGLALLVGLGYATLRQRRPVLAVVLLGLIVLFQTRVIPNAWNDRASLDATRTLARDLAATLPTLGADMAYAPYSLHWLNFATLGRITVCSIPGDRVPAYTRALELTDRLAVLNNFGGAASFVRNSGGSGQVKDIDGLYVLYDVQPPPTGVQPLPTDCVVRAWIDGQPVADPGQLSDHNLRTYVWADMSTNFPRHELCLELREPQTLARIRWVAPGLENYPSEWQFETRLNADEPWSPLGGSGAPDVFFWSGPRFYWDRATYHARVDVAPRLVRFIRLSTHNLSLNKDLAISELDLFGPASPPPADTNQIETLLARVQELGVSRLYCGRWEANQVALHNLKQLWTPRTSPDEDADVRTAWLPFLATTGTAVLVRQEDAGITRAALAHWCLTATEHPVGPWMLFRIDAAQPIAFPSSDLIWSGYGLLHSEWTDITQARRTIAAFPMLRKGGVDGARRARILREALERLPRHPGLVKIQAEEAAIENDPDAAALAKKAEQLARPETPLQIRFGHELQLAGLTGLSGTWHPGDDLPYRLFWRGVDSRQRPAVFLHVRDGDHTVFQDDVAVEDQVPYAICHALEQDGWLPSQDRVLHIPDTTPSGRYKIWLGVWQPETKEHFKPHTDLPVNRERAVCLPVDLVVAPRP